MNDAALVIILFRWLSPRRERFHYCQAYYMLKRIWSSLKMQTIYFSCIRFRWKKLCRGSRPTCRILSPPFVRRIVVKGLHIKYWNLLSMYKIINFSILIIKNNVDRNREKFYRIT